jgi:hypothetical protein
VPLGVDVVQRGGGGADRGVGAARCRNSGPVKGTPHHCKKTNICAVLYYINTHMC